MDRRHGLTVVQEVESGLPRELVAEVLQAMTLSSDASDRDLLPVSGVVTESDPEAMHLVR